MPSYYYTKFQKNPCVGRNERCPLLAEQISCSAFIVPQGIITFIFWHLYQYYGADISTSVLVPMLRC